MRKAVAGLGLALLLAAPAAADFEADVVAVQREQFETARQEFQAAHAAGDARGTFMLGMMAEQGWGAPADNAAAAAWYRQAAEAGLASAQFNLGMIYVDGRGTEQDFGQALRLFSQAAEQGHAGAMNNLGSMYDNGYGVPIDKVEALKWYTLAAGRMKDRNITTVHNNIVRIETQLSGAEIAEAKARTEAWKKAHP